MSYYLKLMNPSLKGVYLTFGFFPKRPIFAALFPFECGYFFVLCLSLLFVLVFNWLEWMANLKGKTSS